MVHQVVLKSEAAELAIAQTVLAYTISSYLVHGLLLESREDQKLADF